VEDFVDLLDEGRLMPVDFHGSLLPLTVLAPCFTPAKIINKRQKGDVNV
jgi:hypothetical protein